MYRFHKVSVPVFIAVVLGLSACSDDTSPIGADLVAGDVTITVDSLTMSLDAMTVKAPKFDSRSQTNLIGRITAPEYGELSCEYVSRLMCASALPLADSITDQHIDSVRLLLRLPRKEITGDSLAPQELKVYLMNERFNEVKGDTVTNEFNAAGYYNPSDLLLSKTYTFSTVSGSGVTSNSTTLTLPIKLTGENYSKFGPDLVKLYKTDPDLFVWPASFAKFLPGIYVKPSFGSGCIANVSATQFMLYYHTSYISTEYVDNEVVSSVKVKRDSVALISTAPEVLSTNRIVYNPAASLLNMQQEGKCVITSPGGFLTRVNLPAKQLIEDYQNNNGASSMITNLTLSLPASTIENNYGIGCPPYLLMIKKTVSDQFFNEGSIPDGKNSFWATFDSSKGEYLFTSFRDYIIDLTQKGEITTDDTDFLIIPVNLELETSTNNYSGTTTTSVTSCTPYISAPTMCELHTEKAKIIFTYTVNN